jgi:hypothetical protein
MVTEEQWLELHKVCLDTVRSAIRGLSGEGLAAKPLPHDDSIGEQANQWEQAADFITDLLLVGPEAKPRYD